MLSKPADNYCFVQFMPHRDENKPDLIGHITFNLLDFSEREPHYVPKAIECCRLDLIDKGDGLPRATQWACGNPPSAKAGRALLLWQEAQKRMTRPDMPTGDARAVYINEDGAIIESDLFDYFAFHLDAQLHASPDMWRPDFAALVQAGAYTGSLPQGMKAPIDPARWRAPSAKMPSL